MSELDTQQYLHCDGCGRVVPMKPEWAGRRLRCKCGGIVQAPGVSAAARPAVAKKPSAIPLAESPSGDGNDGARDGGYGLAPDPAAKPRRKAVRPAPVADEADIGLAPSAPVAAAPTSPVLGYQGHIKQPKDDEEAEQAREYTRHEFILPAVLIAIGLFATFIEARLMIGKTHVPLMIAYVLVNVIINLVLVFLALLFTSKLLDLGLGEIGPAMLKITAVAILPAAAGGIVTALTSGMGGMLAWAVSLGFYFALLYWLFEMDGQEMMICVAILWVIRTWIGYFIFAAILRSLAGDSLPVNSPLGGGAGGGGAGGPGTGNQRAPFVIPQQPGTPPAPDSDDPDDKCGPLGFIMNYRVPAGNFRRGALCNGTLAAL